MKHLSPAFLLFFSFTLLFSCQKEYSLESDGVVGIPGDTTDLLIRAEVEDPVSRVICSYEYGVTGRITKNLANFSGGGVNGDLKIEANRDGSGRLSGAKLVVVSTFNPSGDTANYQLYRNGTGRVIAMTIKPNEEGGQIIYDSVSISYNAANKVSSYIYYSVLRNGSNFQVAPYQKFEFTYTGENVTQRLEYILTGTISNASLLETLNMQYDAKPATRILTEEEYFLELAPVNGIVPSVNNLVRLESLSELDPNENYTSVYAYVYGANNKPASAQVTTTNAAGDETVSNVKFFYN